MKAPAAAIPTAELLLKKALMPAMKAKTRTMYLTYTYMSQGFIFFPIKVPAVQLSIFTITYSPFLKFSFGNTTTLF